MSISDRFRKRGGRRRNLREQGRWDKHLLHSLSRTRLPTWRQIRHLPEVLSSNDSLRLKIGSVLFIAGLAILGTNFYYGKTFIVPAVGGHITEGVVGTPRSLNPLLSSTNDVDMDLVSLIYSSLFTIDGEGKIVGDLVQDYTVSEDQKTYTLSLREGVHWHDGRPLTIDDIIFTIAQIQDPAWKSPLHPAFEDVTVERLGDDLLKLTLEKPFAPFLSKLRFGILPKHIWKDVLPQNALMAEQNLKPVGSGPFRFLSLKRDKRGFVLSYTLERNKDFYGQPPYLKELSFKFYPDYFNAVEALRKRQVDSLSFVPRDLRGEVGEMAHVLPISLEMPQYTAVFFNKERNKALGSTSIRRALTMSIDKNRILNEVLGGDGHPLDFPPISGYTGLLDTKIPHNTVKAGELLDEAGWKLNSDGLREKDDALLAVTLTTVDQPENMGVLQIIKEGWSSIGVDVSLLAVPSSEIHRTVIRPRDYEALLFGQLLEADPDPYPFWHSSQTEDPGLNLALFANRQADLAIEAARKTTDSGAREESYKTFLKVLSEQVPAAFLYSPSYTYPVPETLQGFSGSRISIPADRFASVTNWYLETKRAWE